MKGPGVRVPPSALGIRPPAPGTTQRLPQHPTPSTATPTRASIRLVALTAKQRSKLPPSAFLDPKARRFPVPTQTQAKRAGISEAQRVRTLRSALSRAGQTQAKGVKTVTPTAARRKVATRSAGKVASVKETRGARR